jgi:hypothetical protein
MRRLVTTLEPAYPQKSFTFFCYLGIDSMGFGRLPLINALRTVGTSRMFVGGPQIRQITNPNDVTAFIGQSVAFALLASSFRSGSPRYRESG